MRTGVGIIAGMPNRRILARADLFDTRDKHAWLVVQTPWRSIIESRQLEAGRDLLRVFLTELLRYHDEGWRLNEFSAWSGEFFATKEGETKRCVRITCEDPFVERPCPHGNYGQGHGGFRTTTTR